MRLNLVLFVVLLLVAMGVITAQHHSRKLYIELEQLETVAKTYQTEYSRLQLEQSTWAMHSRLEEYARQKLKMRVPNVERIQVINIEGAD